MSTSAPAAVAMTAETARHEYADVSANLRFHRALALAQLAVFVLVNLAIVALIWRQDSTLSGRTERMLKSAGALSAVLYWIAVERVTAFLLYVHQRAEALEKQLGYRQYGGGPTSKIFNHANASRLLLIAVLIFWITQLFLS